MPDADEYRAAALAAKKLKYRPEQDPCMAAMEATVDMGLRMFGVEPQDVEDEAAAWAVAEGIA